LLVLEQTQPPFETAHVLAVNLPQMADGKTKEQVREFYREATRRVSNIPGVAHVATGFSVPWRDTREFSIRFQFTVEGAKRENAQNDPRAIFRAISPGYFETLGVPLLEGRDFRDTDRDGSERVVIISQSLAQRLFPGREAIDRHLQWTDPVMQFIGMSYEPRRIVGVVPDFDDANIIPNPDITVYQPTEQEWVSGRMFVRAKNDPHALVPIITRTIRDLSAEQPVERASTLEDVRAEVMTPDRLNAIVFGGFATLALLISAVGVAGVLAFSVSGRTREFGIRLALGAQPRSILANVLLEGVGIGGLGVAIGVLVGFGLLRGLGKYIAELQQPGVVPLLISAAVIVVSALIASALPAARASRVDAVQALRAE
jgi:predicted permease